MLQTQTYIEPQVSDEFVQIERLFFEFLKNYKQKNEETNGEEYPYILEAERMKSNERVTMHVDFNHLIQYKTNIDLPFTIITQYYRFEPALKGAIKNFMTKLHPEYA